MTPELICNGEQECTWKGQLSFTCHVKRTNKAASGSV